MRNLRRGRPGRSAGHHTLHRASIFSQPKMVLLVLGKGIKCVHALYIYIYRLITVIYL